MIQLGILDQSPIVHGSNAREALAQTIQVAQLADDLGFSRFWVSEHHNTTSLGGSSPEVLISTLAAKTKRIRVGSGGVMLPHYSAYKVAENFRVLEALYPARIDLGIGRAPGGMPIATRALHEGKRGADYTEQVHDLMYYLTDSLPEGHRFQGLTASPVVDTTPELWLLGSSDSSGALAAQAGTAFTFAHFINGQGGIEVVRDYQAMFRPSVLYEKPQASVSIFVICANSDAEAEVLASSLDLALLMLANGQRSLGTPTVEMAQSYDYSPYERAFVRENRKRMIVGGPHSVKQQIERLANAYGVDEVICVTNMADFERKLQSFQLLADAFR
jgi:luciferase family oxidoreductase group 1